MSRSRARIGHVLRNASVSATFELLLCRCLTLCIGLDPNRYRSTAAAESDDRHFGSLDSLMSDKERYKDADRFVVRCRSCQGQSEFAPVSDRTVSAFPIFNSCAGHHLTSVAQNSILTSAGAACPSCQSYFGSASLQAQLETQIREHVSKYYEGWTVCDDATCGNRSRVMGVYGRRCLRPTCQGTVTFEVGHTRPAKRRSSLTFRY